MKKRLSLLVVAALILSVLPIGVFADVSTANPYFKGSGTMSDPYLIETEEDLAELVWLTNNRYEKTDSYGGGYYSDSEDYTVPGTTLVQITGVGGKAGYYGGHWGGSEGSLPIRYYKMTKDMDMKDYTFDKGGIGGGTNANAAFMASFDGCGHVIRNWTSTGVDNNGIFTFARLGNVSGQGIKNVGVENANITSNNYVCGVLIGQMNVIGNESNGIEGCWVRNSTAYAKTRNGSSGNFIGGVIGELLYAELNSSRTEHVTTVKNCYASNVDLYFTSDGKDYHQFGGDSAGVIGRGTTNFADNTENVTRRLVAENLYAIGKGDKNFYPAVGSLFENKAISTSYELKNVYQLDRDSSSTWTNQGTKQNGITLTAALLEDAFMEDVLGVNGGLPVLKNEYSYITNTISGTNGTLEVTEKAGEVNVKNESVYIKNGSKLTLTVKPDAGYKLKSVTYKGVDKTSLFVSGSAEFNYSDLSDSGAWIATFEEASTTPAVHYVDVKTGDYVKDGATHPAAVAYAKVTGVTNPYEVGMILTRKADGKTLTLKAQSPATAFAIRVFGEGVSEGSFTMQPYMVVTQGSEAVKGDVSRDFSLEK